MAEELRNNLFEPDIFNHIVENVFGEKNVGEYNEEIVSTKLREINLHPFINDYRRVVKNEDHYGFNRILQKIIPVIQQQVFAKPSRKVDVKEELKKEMGIQSRKPTPQIEGFDGSGSSDVIVDKIFNISDVKEFGMKVNPKGNLYETTVFLDSMMRNFSVTNNTTNFSWQLFDGFESNEGSVAHYGEINKIHGIKIGDFYLPVVDNLMTYYGQITTFISEFGVQNIPGTQNRRYHFYHDGVLNTVDNRRFDLSSKEKKTTNTTFEFKTPINTPSSLTFTFGSPMHLITFNQDRFALTTDFTINGGGNILFNSSDTSLVTGDVIFISGYEEAGNDSFVNTVNRDQGHEVTAVVAGLEYSIAAGSLAGFSGSSFYVYRGDRRFFMQLTFLHE